MLTGSGWTTADAYKALLAVHDAQAPPTWTRPASPPETIDWGTIGKPGRKAKRFPANDNDVSGHPLDVT